MTSAYALFLACLIASPAAALQDADADAQVGPKKDPVTAASALETRSGRIEDIDAHRAERLPYIRSQADVVEIDIGPLDTEAEVLFLVDGDEVTREEFRRRVLMYTGLAEVEQQVTNVITLDTIEDLVAAGASREDFLLSEEEIDARIEETKDLIRMQTLQQNQVPDPSDEVSAAIAESGMSPDELADLAVEQFVDSIEQSVGWDAYRDMLAVDASFEKVFLPMPAEATGEEIHDAATGPVPEDDPRPEWLPEVTWNALGKDANGRNLRQFVKSSGALGNPIHPMFKGQVLQSIRKGLLQELGVTYWFDEKLPEGVFVRVGNHDMTTEELWALINPELTEIDMEIVLRELLMLRAMKRELVEAGEWLEQEEFDELFAAHRAEFEGTLLPLDAIIIFRGYTSADRYREHYRYRQAYHRWLEKTMPEDAIEDHYRKGARLFFERGSVIADLAYKGVADLGPFGPETFEEATEQLTASFAGHDEDFREISAEYPRPLVRQQTGGPNDRVFQRNPLRMRLTESELSIFLTGYSFGDDIFYNGVPGQMFGPWATTCRRHAWGAELNAGVWLAKVDGYQGNRALAPFDGTDRDQATQDYLDLNYLYWSQEALKRLLETVEVPAS